MMDEKKISLTEARQQGKLAEFIRQHSKELAEDEEFTQLLERMERDEKTHQSDDETSP